ncbi:MAG: hypothetical protein JNM28_00135 [Armatimonadetes bacterium]|nr:hypothetical protein [Armatimonadota bacterium]MBS1711415.1 hypothetical protein [Armatimonadota bacterium]MBX3107660.1 hypothetical protein [Fimbriimonadaceae bacterium]
MASVAFLLALAGRPDGVCLLESCAQEIAPSAPEIRQTSLEGLNLATDSKFQLVSGDTAGYRAYQAVIRDAEGRLDQVWTVAVTDLDSLPQKPTAEELCALHERAGRTRKGFASQLFQSIPGVLGGRPMVALIGSALTSDTARPLLHISAVFSTEARMYEATWLGFGAKGLAEAQKAIDTIKLDHGGKMDSAKIETKLLGDYSLLGMPFRFRLPGPATPKPAGLSDGMVSHYTGEVFGDDWYATLELAEWDSPPGTTPAEILKQLGDPEWSGFEFERGDGLWSCPDVPIGNGRHARIELAVEGRFAALLAVSAPQGSNLPPRSVFHVSK